MGVLGGFWNPDSTALQIVQSTAPSSPAVGQQWYDTSIGAAKWWNGSAWIQGGIDQGTYTPTVGQGASTNIAKTINQANWWRISDLVWVELYLTMNGSGSAGAAIGVSLPFTSPGSFSGGTFAYLDFSALVSRRGICNAESTDFVQFAVDNTNAALGVDPAITVASPDSLTAFFYYRTDAP